VHADVGRLTVGTSFLIASKLSWSINPSLYCLLSCVLVQIKSGATLLLNILVCANVPEEERLAAGDALREVRTLGNLNRIGV
jgi:hypothetical protein